MASAAAVEQQQQQLASSPQQQQPPAAQASSNSKLVQVAKDVFAGTMGGIAVTMVGHPFDTIKVRLQTQPMDKPIYGEQGPFVCVEWQRMWSQPQDMGLCAA
jgi:hypothetical protein